MKIQCFFTNCFSSNSAPFPANIESSENECPEEKAADQKQRKPGGWKSMPFILGNETCERLASIGLGANFMMYLLTVFNMDQVMASNVINVWSGVTNFSPLIGAFISDAYIGRFKTIAYATFFSFAGMLMLTIITWKPQLHPPHCNIPQHQQCIGPTKPQFIILAAALSLLSLGSAGIRPCSLPFGVDQFDSSTAQGRKDINSFFNWYYTSFTLVMILALTLIVYIQDSVSWLLGFAIPAFLMLIATILFFVGTKIYVHVKPEGSCFTGAVQVVVASFKKRKVNEGAEFYDPPPSEGTVVKKLSLTNQFRFFNKAALITEDRSKSDDPWTLCSIQQVEEAKCIFKIFPIWASGIICFTATAQQSTFTISQASKMDRRLGPNFQVPPGTLSVISMLTVGIWLPFYDRILVPYLRKGTRVEGGITLLQRMGIGMVFSIMSMVAAGMIERVRRSSALLHAGPDGIAPITVFWLAPQLMLMGFAEAFNIIGQVEFYNKEFPENMSSFANSLFSCTMAGASYLSAIMVNVVHSTTGGHGHPDWLTKDINQGRVENLYFMIAGLGVINLGYFLWVASRYRYKNNYFRIDDEEEDNKEDHGFENVELSHVAKE